MCARDSDLRRGARILSPRDMGFGQLYDDVGDAVVVADANTGNVVLANPVAEEMFGYEPDELIGKAIEVLMPPRYREAHRRGMGAYVATGQGHMIDSRQPQELVGLRKDGREFELELTLTRVRAPRINGRFVVAVIRDSSERKAAARALAASEARWRTLVDDAPDLILTTDTTGKIVSSNRAVQGLVGGELVGRSIFEVAAPLADPRLRPAFEQVASAGSSTSFVGRGAGPDGTPAWYHVRLGPIRLDGWLEGFILIATDITAEKASEDAVRQLAARLADAQRLSHVGSWEWEVSDDRLAWSDELYAIYGVDRHTFGGTVAEFLEAIHPDDRVRVQGAIEAAISGSRPFAFDHRVVRPDGQERLVHCQGEVLVNAQRRPTTLVGTCQDVTALRDAARHMAERDAQLRLERERVQERTEFMHAIAHDLQNPLTTIMGYAEFLDESTLTPDQALYVKELERAAQRMQALIADLLDAARLEAGTATPKLAMADLAALLREAAAAIQPGIQSADLTLALDLPAEPLLVRTDARRVGQVLANLLSNAVKFSTDGGEIALRALQTAAGLRIEVSDRGAGIHPEDREKLFRRYSQLEAGRRHGGTGLGLGISRSIVEALGGEIGVTSEPGQGSIFWFTLPPGA
ncbi:MAG: sensor hybrid histidine kinase [Cyanobacteria bacterium RYN_339]|nr:sensor hybrid histidine kinase [Cyanobacteria bacterium RYN_339]